MNDELPHPAGPGRLWGESWYFDFAEPGGAWGGYLRVGSYPNLRTGWAWLVLVGDVLCDGPVQIVEHHLAPPRQHGTELIITGLAGEWVLRCHAPFERWSARVCTPRVSLDLSWRAVAPAYRYERAARYEQPCGVTGEMTVDGRTFAVAAHGQRDHSWGVRDWWRIPWLWFATRLDDGTRVHATQLIVRRPVPAHGYVDPADGSRIEIAECRLSAQPAANGTPPQRTGLSLGPLDLDLTSRWSANVLLNGPDGQAGTLFRSLCLAGTADGRVGSGWLEWNLPGTVPQDPGTITKR